MASPENNKQNIKYYYFAKLENSDKKLILTCDISIFFAYFSFI